MANTKGHIDALIANWHQSITCRVIDALVPGEVLAKAAVRQRR